MPTNLPRINVCVTPDQRDILFELAALQKRSAASLVRQMLDDATPLLRASLPMLRKAAQEHEISKREAEQLIQDALDEMRLPSIFTSLDIGIALEVEKEAAVRNAASGSERGRERPRSTEKAG